MKIENTLNQNEKQLLKLVLESEEPEKAIITAIQICTYFIEEKPQTKSRTKLEQNLENYLKCV